MTQLLERVVDRLRHLSENAQDAMATLILEELDDEQRWEEAFSRSQDQLSRLADKVLLDIQSGHVIDKGMDEL